MDLSSASAPSGDKTNELIALILSLAGGGQPGKGLNLNIPNANGSGPNSAIASIAPPNALQRVQEPQSFQNSSYNGGAHGFNGVQYVEPVPPDMSPHFNQGRLMVGGQYVDTSGNPVLNFKQGGSFQQMADNNKLMTRGDLESDLSDAIQAWKKATAPSTPPAMPTQTTTPAPAAPPLPSYQPQTLPNPYQGMVPPNTSAMNNLGNLSAIQMAGNGGWNLGGFGGSGANLGSTIPSAAYSGAAAIGAGSPFAGGSFNGSPITESIGPTGGPQSGAGGLTSGGGMSAGQIGMVTSAIQGIGQGIGKMFTPGVLGTVQPVPLPQGITFGYTPIRG